MQLERPGARGPAHSPSPPAPRSPADDAISALYAAHWNPLVRLAWLLLHGRADVADRSLAASAEAEAMRHLGDGAMLAALNRLPNRQREVLVLRYFADWSEASIADALGIAPGSVKAHAHRGLAALRARLEESS